MPNLVQSTSQPDRWLTLAQAARLCGVHPVTLRLWADRGLVPCIRTAGGHRRFSEAVLRQRLRPSPTPPPSALADHALGFTRQRLMDVPLAPTARFDDTERERRRDECRALLGLVMHYAGSTEDDPMVLEEATRTGARFAESCLAVGMPLVEAVTTTLFFRDALIESIFATPSGAGRRVSESARIVSRVNQVLNAYQVGLVARYEAAR